MLLLLSRGVKRGSAEKIEDGFSFKRVLWVGLTRDWGREGTHTGLLQL